MERRKTQRYAVKIPARIRWMTAEGSGMMAVGWTQNISVSGAFIGRINTMAVSTAVEMEFSLPHQMSGHERTYVETAGSVVRTGQQGVGIHFQGKYELVRSPLPRSWERDFIESKDGPFIIES